MTLAFFFTGCAVCIAMDSYSLSICYSMLYYGRKFLGFQSEGQSISRDSVRNPGAQTAITPRIRYRLSNLSDAGKVILAIASYFVFLWYAPLLVFGGCFLLSHILASILGKVIPRIYYLKLAHTDLVRRKALFKSKGDAPRVYACEHFITLIEKEMQEDVKFYSAQ